MYRLTLIFLFPMLTTSLFGQKPEVENLINQVVNEVVPHDFQYYNLIDSSFRTYFDDFVILVDDDKFKSLLKEHPDFPIDSFIEKSKNCLLLNWNDFDLNKAKIYSSETIPKYGSQIQWNRIVRFNTSQKELDSLELTKRYNEVIVPTRRTWSKKRKNEAITKAWEIYSNSVRSENKIYFRFSSPLIVDNYAVITISTSNGAETYIFKNINSIWTKILIFNRWVY